MFFLHLVATLDFVNGDLFENLYEEHNDRVYRIAYGYFNNEEDAKDIVQEIFLKVYLNIGRFRDLPREKAIALIVVVTRNHCIDVLRKQSRRLKPSSLTYDNEDDIKEYEIPSPDYTPEEIFLQNELAERVGQYIDSLPDTQRDVVLLRYNFDMKDKDIAKMLKLDVSVVSSRLNRAKNKLQKQLAEERN